MRSSLIFTLSIFSLLVLFQACIEDDILEDFVEAEIRIDGDIDTLAIDDTFIFSANFFNNVGQNEEVDVDWTSSNEEVLTIQGNGLARGISAGEVTVTAIVDTENGQVTDTHNLVVGGEETTVDEPDVISGQIMTTTFYVLEGTFEFYETDSGAMIDIADDYQASSALPGLFIYLSNNRNSIANALEISEVTTFQGSHSYAIPNVSIGDYSHIVYFCKPFNVKVGEASL